MITDKEFRKLMDEAPYLLDSSMLPITRSAAMKAYAENPISLEEFVAGIKTKLPKCAWKEYDDALVRIKQQGDLRTTSQETDDLLFSAHTKQSIISGLKKRGRLAVAAVLSLPRLNISQGKRYPPTTKCFERKISQHLVVSGIIIATLSFFTLAPAGRALAMEIIGYVGRLFGNRLEISINNRPNEIDPDMQEYILVFSSFEELPELGIKPYVIDPTIMDVQSIEYEITPIGKSLHAIYIDENNSYVYVTQYWDQIHEITFQTNSAEYDLWKFGEHTVYVSKDVSDGMFDAFVIYPYSIVQVTTSNEGLLNKIFSQ